MLFRSLGFGGLFLSGSTPRILLANEPDKGDLDALVTRITAGTPTTPVLFSGTVVNGANFRGSAPVSLRQAKTAFKYAEEMPWDAAGEYLMAKSDQTTFNDPERGREKGMSQFLDEKSYKPGLSTYRRDD